MIWVIISILIVLGFVGEAMFLKANLKIKGMNLDKNVKPSLRLRVWKFLGFGFFVGSFFLMAIIVKTVFL